MLQWEKCYGGSQGVLQYLFLFFSAGLDTGVSGKGLGTRLEIPLLDWALPLKILNHESLGVDVPVFFHPNDVASFSYFFSLFWYPLSGYLIQNSITNLSVIKALFFDLSSPQSQISDCAGFCPPLPFCYDRVAVGLTALHPI